MEKGNSNNSRHRNTKSTKCCHVFNQSASRRIKKIQLEIIVVDQSTPENYNELAKKFPKQINFKLTHFDKPNTVKYLNYGWKQAQAQVILFLDDDVTLTKKLFKLTLKHIKIHP